MAAKHHHRSGHTPAARTPEAGVCGLRVVRETRAAEVAMAAPVATRRGTREASEVSPAAAAEVADREAPEVQEAPGALAGQEVCRRGNSEPEADRAHRDRAEAEDGCLLRLGHRAEPFDSASGCGSYEYGSA